jgi:hypothetical protein
MCAHPSTFPLCASGYQYDGLNTCRCVSLYDNDNATAVLEIIVLVIIGMGLVLSLSLVQCHRSRTGLFAGPRQRDNEARVSSSRAQELRTMFRALSHTGTQIQGESTNEHSWLSGSVVGYRQIRTSSEPSTSSSSATEFSLTKKTGRQSGDEQKRVLKTLMEQPTETTIGEEEEGIKEEELAK